MPKKSSQDPADYIMPLNMNGLQGRMLHMPAPASKKREILLLYGHHSSLERWFGLAQVLNRYGSVTMPDLPGFGGMDSLYKIHEQPSLDALADYLAAFVKMRFKKRRITIVGMSFGFVVATRMLQRFPELANRVDILVSLVGFAHKDDFTFSKPRYWFYYLGAKFFSLPVTSSFFHAVCLHPVVLKLVYGKTHNAKVKFADLTPEQHEQMMDIEIWLWRNNDVRTYMYTTTEFLRFDNCKKQVALPVWHVAVKEDHFFSNQLVEQHMRIIFTDFYPMMVNMTKHAPTVIADAKDAAPFVPAKLRRVLASK